MHNVEFAAGQLRWWLCQMSTCTGKTRRVEDNRWNRRKQSTGDGCGKQDETPRNFLSLLQNSDYILHVGKGIGRGGVTIYEQKNHTLYYNFIVTSLIMTSVNAKNTRKIWKIAKGKSLVRRENEVRDASEFFFSLGRVTVCA